LYGSLDESASGGHGSALHPAGQLRKNDQADMRSLPYREPPHPRDIPMEPVQKALWFVESHSRKAISLDEIARGCHVSAYHLTRAFAATIGISLMRYVRVRRLSEAARKLADGDDAEDILSLALDAGYGSHEAFTRAFRDQFGLTPEQVRAQGSLAHIPILEAVAMTSTPLPELAPPRFETRKAFTAAGLTGRYNCDSPAGIPDQWQRLGPYLGHIPGQIGPTCYGVVFNFDREGNFDYLCGAEVAGTPRLPEGFSTVSVPEQKYAVFAHKGHIAGIRSLCAAIWSQWFPKSGHEPVEGPTLEVYGPEFNGQTGLGGFEVWVAIRG